MTETSKVALITGAARRVGAEIACVLHARGINVVLHYQQSEAEAKTLAEQLNAKRQHSALILKADLRQTAELNSLVKQAAAEWGRLDILINNASRFYKTNLESATEVAWDDLMDSNLKAPFFLAQSAAVYLKKQQGCIVNIADVHAARPMRDYSIYCISKAGLVMLTEVLAKELGPLIRVNAVSPGTVMLPEGENELSDERKEKIMNRIALQRYGSANDVAKAVLFLVQDADYVTGQVVTVDGGRSLMI